MSKYWHFFKINFQQYLEYRGDLAVSFLIKIAVFVAFAFVWKEIDREGKTISGYGFNGIVLYYLASQVLDAFITSRTAKDLRDDILRGNLSTKLVRPFSTYLYFLSKHFALIVSETLISLILALPILFFWPGITLGITISLGKIITFFVVSLLGTIFTYNLYLSVGFFAFWTKEASGLQNVVKNSTRFLCGGLIPLDLLPNAFQAVAALLPFQYSLYVPIKILMKGSSGTEFFHSILVISVWIIIFLLLNITLWHKGIKEYEAVGI